jgi:stalled ribosome alternative rescue factor ArfA
MITEREVITMKKQKKVDRRVFKKTGEELQQYLHFRKRGSRVENKKGKGSYNRQEFKKGE